MEMRVNFVKKLNRLNKVHVIGQCGGGNIPGVFGNMAIIRSMG